MENAGVCFLCSPTAIHFIQRNDSIYFKTHCGWNFQWSWCVSFLFCYYHHQSDYIPAPSDKLLFESRWKLMPCNSWWFPSATIYTGESVLELFSFYCMCVLFFLCANRNPQHDLSICRLKYMLGDWKMLCNFWKWDVSIFNCPKCFSDTITHGVVKLDFYCQSTPFGVRTLEDSELSLFQYRFLFTVRSWILNHGLKICTEQRKMFRNKFSCPQRLLQSYILYDTVNRIRQSIKKKRKPKHNK